MRAACTAPLLLWLLKCCVVVDCDLFDPFSEELLVRPLPGRFLLLHWHFAGAHAGSGRHTAGFSRQLADALLEEERDAAGGASSFLADELLYGVGDAPGAALSPSSFSASLSRGAWRPAWGPSPSPAPPGGALTARFDGTNHTAGPGAERGWAALAASVGGWLCARFGSAAPFPHELRASLRTPPGSAVLHAAVAGEGLCAEHFGPLLRQLPCSDSAGLASLLRNRTALLAAPYVALSARAAVAGRGETVDGSSPRVALRSTHTFTLVLRVPVGSGDRFEWADVERALGSRLKHSAHGCAAAMTSSVYLQPPPGREDELNVEDELSNGDGVRREAPAFSRVDVFNATAASLASFALRFPPAALPHACAPATGDDEEEVGGGDDAAASADGSALFSPPCGGWEASSHLTGRGVVFRGIALSLRRRVCSLPPNAAPSPADASPTRVTVSQLLPPWTRVRFATLSLHVDGQRVLLRPSASLNISILPPGVGCGLGAPGHIDVSLPIYSNASSLRLWFALTIPHARLSDLPPAAARGVDIAPARFTIESSHITLGSRASGGGGGVHDAAGTCDCGATPLLCALHAGRHGSGDVVDAAAAGLGDDGWGGDAPCGVGVSDDDGGVSVVLYTAGLLLPLPIPDASMPFNVVAFVGTSIAVLWASTMARLTKRPGFEARAKEAQAMLDEHQKAHPSPRRGLIARVRGVLAGRRK